MNEEMKQNSLLGKRYVISGVVYDLDPDQLEKLSSVGHRVIKLEEIPVGKKCVVAGGTTEGKVIFITRKA